MRAIYTRETSNDDQHTVAFERECQARFPRYTAPLRTLKVKDHGAKRMNVTG